MTLFALAVRAYLVFAPVAPTSDKPVLAASTYRAVPDLGLLVHMEIFLRPIF